jgi:DNA replication protein DnaC
MAKTINQILAESQYLQAPSLQEALKAYEHIHLTDEERDQAILAAKQRKEAIAAEEQAWRIQQENIKRVTQARWDANQFAGFAQHQAPNIFNFPFELDQFNKPVFDLMCFYLAEDPQFFIQAELLGLPNASFSKGICLAGNPGTGKTAMMKLFHRNQRQCYTITNAKKMANEFAAVGEEAYKKYLEPEPNPINDLKHFFQPYTGLCIDDLGTEDITVHYGNRRSVIVDLLELMYEKGKTGVMLHATTNLIPDQLEAYYGARIRSRMREMFNFIERPGNDRRK